MSEGKSSHLHASATGKTVESLTAGTNRLSVVEDRVTSMSRPDVSGAGELPKVRRGFSVQRSLYRG